MSADAPVRLLGDGYQPHVDRIGERLVYSIPVDSGFFSMSFEFEIGPDDLEVLRADPYRRAALYHTLHTILQRSMIRGNPKVTDAEVRDVMSRVLFSSPADLAELIAAVDREHNIRLERYIGVELRRSAGGADG